MDTKTGMRLLALVLPLVAVAPAQMGGMRNGYGTPTGTVLGGMMGGSLSGMMGGGAGLTIGADGTLYLTRTAASQTQSTQTTITTQLAAIDPTGNTKWTLPINASSASQPALGKDGTLFVTTSDWLSWMYNWMYTRTVSAASTNSTLLVVKPGAAGATTLATVSLAGQMASAPQIAADSAGNYVVYVVTVDMASAGSTSGTWLYAFSPTGTLKYKLQLSQAGLGLVGGGSGMMGGGSGMMGW